MTRMAFYDFDGTLVSGNVVERYAFLARRQPSKARAAVKFTKLLLSIPVFMALDLYSRRLFNVVFFREYAGLRRDWLRELEAPLFERIIRPSIYPGSKALVDSDRAAGFTPVLVTGELDFAIAPAAGYFGFEEVISNALVFEDGSATGRVVEPLIAGPAKVEAIMRLCRDRGCDLAECKAYSDSFSDLPMLESVGHAVAVNPDRRLKRVASERGWPILDLKRSNHAG